MPAVTPAEQRAFRDQICIVRFDKGGVAGWLARVCRIPETEYNNDSPTHKLNIGDLPPNGSQTLFRLH